MAVKQIAKKILPAFAIRSYHLCLAYLGAMLYRFPSRRLFVIGVTGTKGKSTTVELVRAMLEAAGHKTASASTIQFCINGVCERNLFKMTMPGRFFLQQFLRKAADQGATHAVIEMTSEGAAQFRHIGIALDALIFTNIAPEHLESHGGFENYLHAKLSLAKYLERSRKRPRIIIANADDPQGEKFLAVNVDRKVPFSLKDAAMQPTEHGLIFDWHGERFTSPLIGEFNLKNILAALSLAEAMGIRCDAMRRALENTKTIAGRAQFIDCGQPFSVVVDYAHTPDSLAAFYGAFPNQRKICVLGNTGGGRDTWKRPEMGSIAETQCDEIILTNEDPYDEDPMAILDQMKSGIQTKKLRIILDRREAIRAALVLARAGDAVLITGKGTDPYIMGPRGSKQVWSDAKVAQEELEQWLKK